MYKDLLIDIIVVTIIYFIIAFGVIALFMLNLKNLLAWIGGFDSCYLELTLRSYFC